jgi:hypothetical protein
LFGDRVLEGQDRSDLEPDRVVGSPVDAEVDLELVAVARGDRQAANCAALLASTAWKPWSVRVVMARCTVAANRSMPVSLVNRSMS